ncbi:helix-turn-helix domain-containing protein [Pseudorhodobacter ferrugineus]|uniref:helix-turn-helix domain-containing protein n=1 Tax=Pseudorhodobacter ferrugineus TaxID=77008 RepID=UPI0003B6EC54|nr:helix-turn-helix transcriptional regulator [Pseudorhodobacter ferrugineus]
MQTKPDKRIRAALFRDRLGLAMTQTAMSQAALARHVGVDRSTISQLLAADSSRLPNAQVVAECARVLQVSADWLLGLTDRPERGAELLAASLAMTEAPRALVDDQIFRWHLEAAGYKIRHVPATLPDMLKTDAMLRWEYDPHLGKSTEQAIGASRDRLNWMQNARSDYEIAMPLHELTAFAQASGYYTGLPLDLRVQQLDHLIALADTLYPSLRLYLFDARRVFSAPVSVFGPLLAVVYLGRHYMAFRDSARVETLTEHFDWLVREAAFGARDAAAHLRQLRATL